MAKRSIFIHIFFYSSGVVACNNPFHPPLPLCASMVMVYGLLNPPTEVYAKGRRLFQTIYKQQSLPFSYIEQKQFEQQFVRELISNHLLNYALSGEMLMCNFKP
jgi:hypothetical protein